MYDIALALDFQAGQPSQPSQALPAQPSQTSTCRRIYFAALVPYTSRLDRLYLDLREVMLRAPGRFYLDLQ